MTTTDDVIANYFRLAVDPDLESYFAQFAETALVEDEGHEYRGMEQIRTWRTSVPPVRYTVTDPVTGTDGITTVQADVNGDFPGSPVRLTFRFGLDAHGQIDLLTIRA